MSAAYKGVQGQNAVIVEALLLENIYSVSSCNQRCLLQSSPFSSPSPNFSSPSPTSFSLLLSLSPPPNSSQPLKPVSRVRLAAVQYGSTVFPFDHIPSRFVCVIGAGDRYDSCDCSFTTRLMINPVFLAVRTM